MNKLQKTVIRILGMTPGQLKDGIRHGAKLYGRYKADIYDKNGLFIAHTETPNIVVDEGLDSILNVYLHGSTQITTWYCVMFENDFTPDGDETYAVPGYTECTAYDEATRPAYTAAASSSQSVTNSANKAAFTMNDTKTLYGAALVGGGTNGNTKGDTAGGGTLFSAGRFTASQPVIATNVVNLTYTIGAADDGA